MDRGRWDRVKAGHARVYITEKGACEVGSNSRGAGVGAVREISDGDGEQWWGEWAGLQKSRSPTSLQLCGACEQAMGGRVA